MIYRAKQSDIDIINEFKSDLANKEYLKYYELAYFSPCSIAENEWCDIQRVSKDKDGNILGFIFMAINRAHDRVEGLELVNLTKKPNSTLTRDMLNVISETKDKYRKICFEVVVGNPAEKIYDRIVKLSHGRIVGISEKQVRLTDEQFYDLKLYEIMGKAKL